MDAKSLCLGALALGDASGYEIRKLYEEGLLSAIHWTGYGSIYPALTALLEEGLVTMREEDARDGRPARKVYALTDSGRDAFLSTLSAVPGEDRFRSDSLFMISFAHLLTPDRLHDLIDAYGRYLQQERAAFDTFNLEVATPGQRFMVDIGRTMYDTLLALVAEHRIALEQAVGAAQAQKATGTHKPTGASSDTPFGQDREETAAPAAVEGA